MSINFEGLLWPSNYSKIKMNRQFLQYLSSNKKINISDGESTLFYYALLNSHASPLEREFYIYEEAYPLLPGDGIYELSELINLFGQGSLGKTITILQKLQSNGFITFSLINNTDYVKYSIVDWNKVNFALSPHPCFTSSCFSFYLSSEKAYELLDGKLTEMDILLDLWMLESIIIPHKQEIRSGASINDYNYYSFDELASRWRTDEVSVEKMLNKFMEFGYFKTLQKPFLINAKRSTISTENPCMPLPYDLGSFTGVTPFLKTNKNEVILKTQVNIPSDFIFSRETVTGVLNQMVNTENILGYGCLLCPNKKIHVSELNKHDDSYMLEAQVKCASSNQVFGLTLIFEKKLVLLVVGQ